MPLTSLPDPDRSLLPGSPLDLVVSQIRFEAHPEVSSAEVGLAFHQAIGGSDGDYGKLDSLTPQALNVELTRGRGASVTHNDGPSGWRFASSDGAWLVSLMPEHIALESKGQYPGWEEFSERLDGLLDALVTEIAPAVERRIGLRYIDLISEVEASKPEDWTAFLAPELLGLAGHAALGSYVANARQEMILDLGADHGCIFKHGFLPSDTGSIGYLLDYDVFREAGRAFEREAVRETLGTLHEDALKLFQAMTTDALVERFRG